MRSTGVGGNGKTASIGADVSRAFGTLGEYRVRVTAASPFAPAEVRARQMAALLLGGHPKPAAACRGNLKTGYHQLRIK